VGEGAAPDLEVVERGQGRLVQRIAEVPLVLKCILMIQCDAFFLVFPAKAGTQFCPGHRPSPV
jgi:hypothetical protein